MPTATFLLVYEAFFIFLVIIRVFILYLELLVYVLFIKYLKCIYQIQWFHWNGHCYLFIFIQKVHRCLHSKIKKIYRKIVNTSK